MMEFLAFAAAHGLDIRRLEHGKITRCQTVGHPHKRNGAYLFDGNWGFAQDWSQHLEPIYWKSDSITRPEDLAALRVKMEASRKAHARERAIAAQNAATKAVAIIGAAKSEQHAYLDSKGYPDAVGLVYYPTEDINLLVIPMRIGRDIVGCQLIDRFSVKKFLFGQRCNGAEYVFGNAGTDIWCEGYATALSIKTALEAIKYPCRVHACFSAGNMQRMATRGFVVADNDASLTGEKAAQATGLPFYLPEIEGEDLNDQWRRDGTFKTAMVLRNWLQSTRKVAGVSDASITTENPCRMDRAITG